MLSDIKDFVYRGLSWIVEQLVALLDLLFNAFIDLFNLLISAVGVGIGLVVSLLPVDSTCVLPDIPDVPVVGIVNFINWILPLEAMACVVGVVCFNYVLYFTVGRVLKFLQVA